ncbi:MSMEG_0572 family nitrogen starvation response protein [Robbsia sp. Bb-Pol-6]|uniref:MSMEG_0572 family nitrogen starvation response protein n=1 Tax=Robbsia betulipollinis TaxID=2981849 RepID=A0ABT3ZSY2_9BURK|nr:MSMEG_0572/Sll0783 family nitrogen starvation response protein [Robbsia betulipollinis]MCY0389646.1 MSMEG_0572 family nitrogen starvation response protein [Robbsia betulipollinis]
MPAVDKPAHKAGDFFVDYEEKVFEDVKAEPGEKALVTFHTVAFEGSIGLVNMLQATRLQRKGFETSILLYGPGVTLGIQRGFPTLGDEAFPGHLAVNKQIKKFMEEGGKVYACRFALQALYGHGEPSLIEGIRPISPLDVLDIVLLHRRDNAFILDTWTV